MHFWCYTYLKRSEVQFPQTAENLKSIEHEINQKLKDIQKYAFTEIMASYSKEHQGYVFKFERSDCDSMTFLMKPNFMDIKPDNSSSSIVVDVLNLRSKEVKRKLETFQDNLWNHDLFVEDFVERIRIRCIKATKNRNLPDNEKTQFLNYLNKIENYVQGNHEKYEEAFSTIDDFYCENKRKLQNNRLSDLTILFNKECKSATVPKNTKKRCITKMTNVYTDTITGYFPSAKRKKSNDKRDHNYYGELETIEIDRSVKNLIANWQKSENLKNLVMKNWKKEFLSWDILIKGFKNWTKLSYLDLSNSGLKDLPDSVVQSISESLSILNLSNNDLETLPFSSIKSLKNLKVLNLSNNKRLRDIEWECLPQTLEQIYLKNTNCDILPPVINKFINLKVFAISSESLQTISWKSLPPTLEKLYICGGEKLNSLEDLKYLINLQKLKLRNANFDKDIWEKMPPNIKEIDLSWNKLLHLNTSLEFLKLSSQNCWENLSKNCPNLSSLNLKNNHLFMMASISLENFTMLKVLNLSKNKLTSICCDQLPLTLEELYLTDSQIKTITFIERLKRLKVLNLTNNEITRLPAGIIQLQQLIFLFLSNNRLIAFPKSFETLKNLMFLDLRYNNFHSKTQNLIPVLWERLPKNLSTLKMSGNYLGELPCQLSKLPLDYLEAIDCNIQHVCPHLQKYHRHNISKVFETNLLNNDDIKIMDLRENPDLKHLSFVPEKIYDPPSVAEKFVIDKSFEKANFAFVTNHEVQDKTKVQYRGKIPVYDFTKKPLTFQEKEQICHCCSQCGIQCNDENAVIQTMMVMDFYLVKVGSELTKIPEKSVRILELPMKPEEEIKTYKISSTWIRAKKNEKSIFDYELTKLLPEKWKTKVRTIMCDNCIEKREKKNSDYYTKNKNISEHKNVPEPSANSADEIIDYNRNLIKTVTKESKPQPNQEASTSLHQTTPSELIPNNSNHQPINAVLRNTIISVPDAPYPDNPNDYIYNPNSLNPSEGSVDGNIYYNRNQNRAITEKSIPQPDQEASTSLYPPPTYNSVPNNSNHQPINTVLGNTIISTQEAPYSNDYLYNLNYPHQNTNIQIPQQSYPNYNDAYSNDFPQYAPPVLNHSFENPYGSDPTIQNDTPQFFPTFGGHPQYNMQPQNLPLQQNDYGTTSNHQHFQVIQNNSFGTMHEPYTNYNIDQQHYATEITSSNNQPLPPVTQPWLREFWHENTEYNYNLPN